MIKGAIFDVDGTLLDSMSIWEDAGGRYLKSIGIEAEPGLGQRMFQMSLEESAAYIKERYHMEESAAEIVAGVLREVGEYYLYEAPLKPGAKDFLCELHEKKVPMVVATSNERKQIENAFERLGILSYFKHIFTCSEVAAGKTQPVIYQKAAEYLGTLPEETYVFEDVLHAIKTASKAGFKTVGVYDRFSEGDQEEIRNTVDFYLSDYSEYDRILNES